MAPPKYNFVEKSKIHACVSGLLVSGTVIFIVQIVGETLKKHGPEPRGFRVSWGVCGKHVKQISPADWKT